VQHLTGLSADLVDETRSRGVPTLVTLNDYWLLCQRGQLLDLDLARCGGPHAHGCARCLHTSPDEAARRTRGKAQVFESATHFLAPSATLRDLFVSHGLPAAKVSLMRQGVDHSLHSEGKSRSDQRLRIGFLGSLMVSKAPHVLLEAFATLPQGAATLDVFGSLAAYHGDDSYRRRLAPLLGAPGVRWSGGLEHARVSAALAALDVIAVTSVWLENAPFVVEEAFASGVPVVASDIGGLAERVEHEKSGLLFPPGDVSALAWTLRRLLDEPELLPRLRAGLPRVLGIEDDAEQTRELYRKLRAGP
jgi:glycosyltransferase involved in cell wall biosynthesis